MTLKEACESGKPFRHKHWTMGTWAYVSERGVAEFIKDGEFVALMPSHAISDDWEIQQKEHYTRADVERAILKLHDTYKASYSYDETWLEIGMRAADNE